MDNNLPLQIRLFNEKVRAMNQSNGKILTLNAQEARGLHAEIYELLVQIATYTKKSEDIEGSIKIDGGSFR
jgi:hypothetical protein